MIRLAGRVFSARISKFALIGAFGTLLNLLIMMALIALGIDYIPAALIAGETTIVTNFIMQEKLAFTDGRARRRPPLRRFVHSLTFNSLEALARIPFLWILVEYLHLASPMAQAGTLAAAFFLRYAYHVKLIYAPLEAVTSPAPARAVLHPSPEPLS